MFLFYFIFRILVAFLAKLVVVPFECNVGVKKGEIWGGHERMIIFYVTHICAIDTTGQIVFGEAEAQ